MDDMNDIYRRHAQTVYKFLLAQCHDPDLAEELTQTGVRHLDRDENITVIELPIGEVIANFASDDYSHAFMGTALALYMRYRGYHR